MDDFASKLSADVLKDKNQFFGYQDSTLCWQYKFRNLIRFPMKKVNTEKYKTNKIHQQPNYSINTCIFPEVFILGYAYLEATIDL